jgi:hypothetical protein
LIISTDFGGSSNSDPKSSCEDTVKGLWKLFKKFDESHSEDLKGTVNLGGTSSTEESFEKSNSFW